MSRRIADVHVRGSTHRGRLCLPDVVVAGRGPEDCCLGVMPSETRPTS